MQLTQKTKNALRKSNVAKAKVADIFGVTVQSVNLWIKQRPTHKNLLNLECIEIYANTLNIPKDQIAKNEK